MTEPLTLDDVLAWLDAHAHRQPYAAPETAIKTDVLGHHVVFVGEGTVLLTGPRAGTAIETGDIRQVLETAKTLGLLPTPERRAAASHLRVGRPHAPVGARTTASLTLEDVMATFAAHLRLVGMGVVGGSIRYNDGCYELLTGLALHEMRVIFEGPLHDVLLEAKRLGRLL